MGDIAGISAGQQADQGQKRQVSVLFADMVGYTSIIAALDEEKSLEFVRLVYETLVGAVEEHGGTVRDFAGDSIMALFGIPDALEDPALRACRAATSINMRHLPEPPMISKPVLACGRSCAWASAPAMW